MSMDETRNYWSQYEMKIENDMEFKDEPIELNWKEKPPVSCEPMIRNKIKTVQFDQSGNQKDPRIKRSLNLKSLGKATKYHSQYEINTVPINKGGILKNPHLMERAQRPISMSEAMNHLSRYEVKIHRIECQKESNELEQINRSLVSREPKLDGVEKLYKMKSFPFDKPTHSWTFEDLLTEFKEEIKTVEQVSSSDEEIEILATIQAPKRTTIVENNDCINPRNCVSLKPKCFESFSRNLNSVQIHNLYKCAKQKCYESFSSEDSLDAHMKLHETFKCAFCDKTYRQKISLTTHITSVHEKLKPFQCPHCVYASCNKGTLKLHVRTVHEQLKFLKCYLCNYRYNHKSGLVRHLKDFHQHV